MSEQSNLEKILSSGKFAVTAEIGPPRGADPTEMIELARKIKGSADAFNLTDNQTAIVRLSSIGSAVLLMKEGIEPVIQMTCRDRNRIALQSDLLGASAIGVKNVLCLTGDHHTFGNEKSAKGGVRPRFDLTAQHLQEHEGYEEAAQWGGAGFRT